MFKFFVLGVILSQAVVENCYGYTLPPVYDSQPDTIMEPVLPPKNDSSDAMILHKDGQYHIYASRLNLFLGSSGNSPLAKVPTGFASNYADRKIDGEYVVTEGIGAHKLHVRKLSWGKARRMCVDEGGHLAIIRTDAEEQSLLGMMIKNSVTRAWIGYHASTEKGDWFTVLDEPLGATGWARWSKAWSPNPDEQGSCAELVTEGGMVNLDCKEERSFICKVSVD